MQPPCQKLPIVFGKGMCMLLDRLGMASQGGCGGRGRRWQADAGVVIEGKDEVASRIRFPSRDNLVPHNVKKRDEMAKGEEGREERCSAHE